MLISTRGTNAIRAITDMATHNGKEEYICISSLSTRLNISRKYLETIMTLLAKNKLVDVAYGKCGGYKLNRNPEEYSLFDILIVTEEKLQTVSCPCIGEKDNCVDKNNCVCLPTYQELHDLILHYLKSKTIQDLISSTQEK